MYIALSELGPLSEGVGVVDLLVWSGRVGACWGFGILPDKYFEKLVQMVHFEYILTDYVFLYL